MPPSSPSAASLIIILSSSPAANAAAAAATNHHLIASSSSSSARTILRRSCRSSFLRSSNYFTTMTAAADKAPSKKPSNLLPTTGKFSVSWRPARPSRLSLSSFVPSLSIIGTTTNTRRRHSLSVSSVSSFVSSSSSRSDDCSSESPSSSERNVSTTTTSSSRRFSSTSSGNKSKLSSSRGRGAITLLPSYLIDARAVTRYSPSSPEGALQLSVAENQLSELPVKDLVGLVENTAAGGVGALVSSQSAAAEKGMRLVDVLSCLAKSEVARPSDEGARAANVFEREMIYYQPTQGSPGLRAAMAAYLNRLLLGSAAGVSKIFNPDNVVVGAGCNAVLENLCMVLADPGDAVMIPTPYYAAFEFDLVARAGCHIVPVNTFDYHSTSAPSCGEPVPAEYYYPNRSSLDAAYDRATDETGRAPRVLLLSHPNNPLGVCYPPAVIRECVDWCREREVHLVSDEIYAGSVYRTTTERGEDTFVSAMALACDEGSSTSGPGLGLGPYVHLVYALSKDFALSGLRVGAAYTENEEILMPLQKLNDMCQISSQTQLLVERMLTANAITKRVRAAEDVSRKFTDVYLDANAGNIRERCDELQTCLDELGIPHLPADSGLFAWLDLREFLPSLPAGVTEAMESLESKERRERELYLSLMKEHGLLFTPGMSMRNERAGFFRFVFTAASEEEFTLGLKRLREFVEETRK